MKQIGDATRTKTTMIRTIGLEVDFVGVRVGLTGVDAAGSWAADETQVRILFRYGGSCGLGLGSMPQGVAYAGFP
ncbi:MAG: hypothetical protein CMJ25_22095 [Phycisphaerae bacterium]|nr:hypothetical protein [Phycisphaerae bacterium]